MGLPTNTHPVSLLIRTAVSYKELRGTPSCLAASLAAWEAGTPSDISSRSCASICAFDGASASLPDDPSTTTVTSPCTCRECSLYRSIIDIWASVESLLELLSNVNGPGHEIGTEANEYCMWHNQHHSTCTAVCTVKGDLASSAYLAASQAHLASHTLQRAPGKLLMQLQADG